MKLGDTIPDKALAILTVIVIGFVVWDGRPGSLVEYLIGVIIGGVTVFVFMSTPSALQDTPDETVRRWIYGGHAAHSVETLIGTLSIEHCTEPECEAAMPVLDELDRRSRKESRYS